MLDPVREPTTSHPTHSAKAAEWMGAPSEGARKRQLAEGEEKGSHLSM